MTINEIKALKYLTFDTLQKLDVWKEALPYLPLALSNPRQLLYHIEHSMCSIPLCFCNKQLAWHPDKREYRKFCSKKCTAIGSIDQAKTTSLRKYGVTHHSQSASFNEKVKTTSVKKYGKEHYSKTQEFKDRSIYSNMKNFGVPYAAQSKEVQAKTVANFLIKYGVENPMQDTKIKESVSQSNKKLGYSKLLAYRPTLTALFTQDEYANKSGGDNKFAWRCNECNSVFDSEITTTLRRGCPTCNPSTRTWGENIIFNWLTEQGIQFETNNTSVIKPYHLDFLILELNLAIEFNGTYWHSEKANRGSRYHFNKYKACQEQGIRLIQIFEHELILNELLIKERLMHALGKTANKIAGRKLKTVSITPKQSKEFLSANHLQGAVPAKFHYGLVDSGNKLYAVMSFAKARYSSKLAEWEITRFASLSGWSIAGGAQKLLSAFVKEINPSGLMSYADLKWGRGDVYEKLKFKFSHYSTPNYWYFKDMLDVKSRIAFQKHKLPKELHHLGSEWKIMQHLGWNRFWDCGNAVWVWQK